MTTRSVPVFSYSPFQSAHLWWHPLPSAHLSTLPTASRPLVPTTPRSHCCVDAGAGCCVGACVSLCRLHNLGSDKAHSYVCISFLAGMHRSSGHSPEGDAFLLLFRVFAYDQLASSRRLSPLNRDHLMLSVCSVAPRCPEEGAGLGLLPFCVRASMAASSGHRVVTAPCVSAQGTNTPQTSTAMSCWGQRSHCWLLPPLLLEFHDCDISFPRKSIP